MCFLKPYKRAVSGNIYVNFGMTWCRYKFSNISSLETYFKSNFISVEIRV